MKAPFKAEPSLFVLALLTLGFIGVADKIDLVQKDFWSGPKTVVVRGTAVESLMCTAEAVEKQPSLFVSCGGFLP